MVNNLLLSNKQRSQIFDNFNTILNILATILFRMEFCTEIISQRKLIRKAYCTFELLGKTLNNTVHLKLLLILFTLAARERLRLCHIRRKANLIHYLLHIV